MKKWKLTVVPCYRNHKGEWQIDSVQAISVEVKELSSSYSAETCLNDWHLLRRAKRFCKPGLAVIVRPMFNDLYEDGVLVGFREWRSFDGGPLEEVKFPAPQYRKAV